MILRQVLNRFGLGSPSLSILCEASPDQVMLRLRRRTVAEKFFSWNRAEDFVLHEKAGNFRIRKSIRYQNSFQSFFYGKLLPTPQGCKIVGRFSWHPLVRILFLAFAALPLVSAQQHQMENLNRFQIYFICLFSLVVALVGDIMSYSNRRKMETMLKSVASGK